MARRRIPGPVELLGRGRMWASAASDRLGLLPWESADVQLDRPSLPFPVLTPELAGIVSCDDLIARADLVLSGRFPLLGVREGINWGTSPDWFLDPLAGRSAPRAHFSRVPYLNHAVVGDHKVTWELNRHQWMIWLAMAARLTGDLRYTDALWLHLSDWLERNPRGEGMNWASSLEVAFRAIAWTWVLHVAPSLPPEPLSRAIAGSLGAHGLHIERWLSTWFSPNTHLTGEALALLYLGASFPGMRRARAWREQGWRILCEQAPLQIRPDGTYFEQSGWYQVYTSDFYQHALILASHTGQRIPEEVRDLAYAAGKALRAMSHADGIVIRWGDDDGGKLLPIASPVYGAVNDSLALAAVLHDDPSLLPASDPLAAGSVDAVAWMLGETGVEKLRELHSARPGTGVPSVALTNGGWVALRSQRIEAFMDAGEHSALSGAHAHADALALEIAVDGRAVIADPGTYRYMGPGRDEFRSTLAHSALLVGELSSAEPDGPFRWKRFTHAELVTAHMKGAIQIVRAFHDGFAPHAVSGSGRTWRELILLPDDVLLVIDHIYGKFTGKVSVAWRPPAGIVAELSQHRINLAGARGDTLATIVMPADCIVERSVAGFSPGYAVRAEVSGARVFAAEGAESHTALLSMFLPGAAASHVRVERLQSVKCGWSLSLPHGRASVILGDGEVGAVDAQASLTVVLGDEDSPQQVCIAAPRALAIGGATVDVAVKSDSQRDVLLLTKRDNMWFQDPS